LRKTEEGKREKIITIFLMIAYGSGAELETQIEIARGLPFGKNLDFTKVENLLNEIMRMLNKMLSTLRT